MKQEESTMHIQLERGEDGKFNLILIFSGDWPDIAKQGYADHYSKLFKEYNIVVKDA